MNKCRWYLFGGLSLFAIELTAGGIMLARAHGFSAREKPGAVETWIAQRAREAVLPSEAGRRANPVPNTPEVLADARAHWADHCALCHANNGSGDTEIGKRMYPPPPDMRRPATQKLTDGELFYMIQNGVRLGGMPAWAGTDHDAEDSWKLVRFIRHLPEMTFGEQKEMEKLNPKGPEERQEEEEEEKFLNGEDTNASQIQHHHH